MSDSATSDLTVEESWTEDIECVLKNINMNSDYLQEEHRKMYLYMKKQLYYYRIPIIIMSSVNSVMSVGLTTYVEQSKTSVVNCLVSLLCACISAVELFVGVNKSMEASLASYHGYKLLTIKISSCLKLKRSTREPTGNGFLKDCLHEYTTLLENSIVLFPHLDDVLVQIDSPRNKTKQRSHSSIL